MYYRYRPIGTRLVVGHVSGRADLLMRMSYFDLQPRQVVGPCTEYSQLAILVDLRHSIQGIIKSTGARQRLMIVAGHTCRIRLEHLTAHHVIAFYDLAQSAGRIGGVVLVNKDGPPEGIEVADLIR